MKKILIASLLVLLASCTSDGEKPLEDSLVEDSVGAIESVNYLFDGETFKIYFEENEDGELEAVPSERLSRLDEIIEENENLIYHDIDEDNMILFQNDAELNQYLKSIGKPLAETTNNAGRSTFPFTCSNLEIYDNARYERPILWATNSQGNIEAPCGTNKPCHFASFVTDEIRLKNLAITANWTKTVSVPIDPIKCLPSQPTPPNDKISSLRVRSCFARFYEHADYKGRSITRDARPNAIDWYSDLGNVRYRGKWTNRISSIKLSN